MKRCVQWSSGKIGELEIPWVPLSAFETAMKSRYGMWVSPAFGYGFSLGLVFGLGRVFALFASIAYIKSTYWL
jgi:hypothetical protein